MKWNSCARWRDRGVLGDDRAALAGGEVLGREERERGDVGEVADRAAVGRCRRSSARRRRACSAPTAVGDRLQRVVVGGVAGVVDGGDDLGAVGDERRSTAAGSRCAVSSSTSAKTTLAPQDRGARRGRHERHRRGDDLVARADAERGVRHVQRGGAGGAADRPVAAGQVAEIASSKAATGGPVVSQSPRRTAATASTSLVGDRLPAVGQHQLRCPHSRISRDLLRRVPLVVAVGAVAEAVGDRHAVRPAACSPRSRGRAGGRSTPSRDDEARGGPPPG